MILDYYCAFMMSCFVGDARKSYPGNVTCPERCECYDAPANGIDGNDSTSLICGSIDDILSESALSFVDNRKTINTLVIHEGKFTGFNETEANRLPWLRDNYAVQSLILEGFKLEKTNSIIRSDIAATTSIITSAATTPTTIFTGFTTHTTTTEKNSNTTENNSNTDYIFELFDKQTLKYLTIHNSNFAPVAGDDANGVGNVAQFVWNRNDSVARFLNLQALSIENCYLPYLDNNFAAVSFCGNIHTLSIKRSSLAYIDRSIFGTLHGIDHHPNLHYNNNWPRLRRLILSGNELRNLLFLTDTANQTLCQLWWLDLRDNALIYLPPELERKIPALKALYISGNRFTHFDIKSIEPWFAINEVWLADLDRNQSIASPVLYYSTSMGWITQLETYSIKANFLSHSLMHDFVYICPFMRDPVSWSDIPSECKTPFSRDPTHLWLDPINKRLYREDKSIHFDVAGKSLSTIVFIVDQNNLYVDSYLENRKKLFKILNEVTNNALRIGLFGERIFRHYLSNGQNESEKMKKQEIQLFFDQVVDLLDEIEYRKWKSDLVVKYVQFVIWPAELFTKNKFDNLSETIERENAEKNFEKTILKPLINQIARHPALLAIEIVDRFLVSQFSSSETTLNDQEWSSFAYDSDHSNIIDEFANLTNSKNIENEFRFLQQQTDAVRRYSGERPVGFSIDTRCKQCLHFASTMVTKSSAASTTSTTTTLESIPKQDLIKFDFVTLITDMEQPLDWPKFVENASSIFPDVSIFYVLKQGTASDATIKKMVADISNCSAGYFIEK